MRYSIGCWDELWSVINELFAKRKQTNFPPRNAEDTEIRRKFFSANLGDFGGVRRINLFLFLWVSLLDFGLSMQLDLCV